jgi:hypothetical protein
VPGAEPIAKTPGRLDVDRWPGRLDVDRWPGRRDAWTWTGGRDDGRTGDRDAGTWTPFTPGRRGVGTPFDFPLAIVLWFCRIDL